MGGIESLLDREVAPFTSNERIASIAAVIHYLIENGEITIKPGYKVLEIGSGSGVGVFVWRAFGIQDENITAVDISDRVNINLLGQATFVKSDAPSYLKGLVGQKSFDIISAFRIPQAEHDFRRSIGGQSWFKKISDLLELDGFYMETYSEFQRLPPPLRSGNTYPLKKSIFSFMGDCLEVPDKPLLKQYGIPDFVMMGHPDGVFEQHTELDGRIWIPCDPITGNFKTKTGEPVRVSIGHTFCRDEYGVWAHHYMDGRKKYDFGRVNCIEYLNGYKDNLVFLYRK